MRLVNERLRTVMIQRKVTPEDLAASCEVDVKTVERWISLGRQPLRRHRWAVAQNLGVDESYLWPPEEDDTAGQPTEQAELVAAFPNRASVPQKTWVRLLKSAQEHIDVLVFSGTFFAQTNPRVAAMLAERADAGVRSASVSATRPARRSPSGTRRKASAAPSPRRSGHRSPTTAS